MNKFQNDILDSFIDYENDNISGARYPTGVKSAGFKS